MTDNPPIKIYVNKTGNRITFKIKTGYYLERLMLQTMKLLASTKSKIAKDKNSENVAHFRFIVMLLTIIINAIQEFHIHLKISRLVNY